MTAPNARNIGVTHYDLGGDPRRSGEGSQCDRIGRTRSFALTDGLRRRCQRDSQIHLHIACDPVSQAAGGAKGIFLFADNLTSNPLDLRVIRLQQRIGLEEFAQARCRLNRAIDRALGFDLPHFQH